MTIRNIIFATFALSLLGLLSCEPAIDDKIDLPAAPTEANFTVIDLGNNTYQLVNTTDGGFLFQWDLGDGTTATAEEVEVTYPKAGAYIITLTVFNAGGHASGTKSVVVAQDLVIEAEPCEPGTLAEYISNCDTKTWKLNPDEGALLVGRADYSETWWQNDLSVVDERFCAWDDTWTFTGDGDMIYDTQGDIWGEDYLGFNFECVPTEDLADNVSAWGNGNHSYIADDATQQLQLNGVGAFMGIPKAANGSEVGFPVGSITYDVVGMDTNAEGKDLVTIAVFYTTGDGDAAVWQFTFVEV